MKTILFPTDFSTNAAHAAKYLGILANKLNANVVLMNVYQVPYVAHNQLPIDIPDPIYNAKDLSKELLSNFKKDFLKSSFLHPNSVTTRLEYGFIGEKIIQVANEIEADIIILGTKGASNVMDKWIGTVAEQVMSHAHCMVLIVPEKTKIKFPTEILYAADLKYDEVHATDKIIEIATSMDCKCKVLHIQDNLAKSEDKNLDYLGYEINKKTEYVQIQKAESLSIIEEIEDYIKLNNPDILALAREDKNIFTRLFNKSVTKHFVFDSLLPILIFRKE